MKKNKDDVKLIIEKYISATQAELREPTTFTFGDKETAVPDRSIPLSELWSRFVRGENIIDERMTKQPTYNPIENNPFKKKGLDMADIPQIKADNAAFIDNAYAQAQQEIEASKQAQKAQDVLQNQEVKPEL